jgi:DeoR family transcriptional regulator, aga operon transcriptional repressor
MTSDILEAELNAIMIRSAREVTVVTDSSKIGRSSLSLIAPIHSVHRIITDSGIMPRHAELLKLRGIQVVIVPARPSD